MNRRSFGSVTLLALGLVVVGCSSGPSSNESGSTADTTADRGPGRLSFCNGPAHIACAAGTYCRPVLGAGCLGGDALGLCAAEPQVCPQIVKPACGCDGKTYPNDCEAAAAGVGVVHEGACADAGPAACIQNVLCVIGDHYDATPGVCACVPDSDAGAGDAGAGDASDGGPGDAGETDGGTAAGDAGTVACGGIAARPCPGAGRCVDVPNDGCDPSAGGADCGGSCQCVQTALCVIGAHFDSSPSVCACVPSADAGGGAVACGKTTCGPSQICCSASCGICGARGGACPAIACLAPPLTATP